MDQDTKVVIFDILDLISKIMHERSSTFAYCHNVHANVVDKQILELKLKCEKLADG
jgi:hypothetical protein